MTTTTPVSRGRSAYIAYGMQRNFRTYDDRPMPEWNALPDEIQRAWIAAAGAVWDIASVAYGMALAGRPLP
jgi:hypothetical protein